jgi:hypothetical protein
MGARALRMIRAVGRGGLTVGLALAALALAVPARGQQPAKAKPKTGLLVNEPRACTGYTLIASVNSTDTFLVDMQGRVVHTWKSDCNPGLVATLLDNGNLLRAGQVRNPPFFGGGAGGRIQEFTWDGKLVWDYTCSSDTQLQNHDALKLPNGNYLLDVWEKKSAKDAVAAGRRPETVGDSYLLSACLLEVQPTGKTTGKVVWEWHAWDHLVQEFDAQKAHFADVAAHPELIDLNFGSGTIAAMVAKPEELQKLRAIGYVGGAGRKPQRPQTDWLHVNSIAYNADLDQILLTVYEFSEVWAIDHGTTTAEAAGHSGGRYGKGGDLLYRWGNPAAYRAGPAKDQKLFGPHNGHWIGRGLPGAGHILIFNNGMRRIGGAYSSVDEFTPPVAADGRYERAEGKAFGPDKPVWSYAAKKRYEFYAPFISGAERLTNGDTLVCSGTNGTVFEVTPEGETVWKYVNPTKGGPPFGGPPMGGPPFGGPPKLGQVLPPFLQGGLNLTGEQKKQLEATEKALGEKLGKLLTAEQKKRLAERPTGFDPRNFPAPGQLLARGVQERMKLSEDQQKELAELQKEADGQVDQLLKDDQKKRFKEMQDFAKRFVGGPPGGGPPGGGPPGGGPPGGRGGPRGGFPGFGGPGGGSGLFRAPRYGPDFPGLAGKELKGSKTIEELQAEASKDRQKGPTKK